MNPYYHDDYGPYHIQNKMIDYLMINHNEIQHDKFISPINLCALFLSNCVFGSKLELYYKLFNIIYQFTLSMYNIEYLLCVRNLIGQSQIQLVNEYIIYFDKLMFEHKLIEPYRLNELIFEHKLIEPDKLNEINIKHKLIEPNKLSEGDNTKYVTILPETLFMSCVKSPTIEANELTVERSKYTNISVETLFMSFVDSAPKTSNINIQQNKYTNISLDTLFKSCSNIEMDIVLYKKSLNNDNIQMLNTLILSYYKICGIEQTFNKLHTQNINNNIYILGIGYGNCNGQDWDIQPYISESVLRIKNNKNYNEPFNEAAIRGLMEECSLKLIDGLSIDDYKSIQRDNSTIYSINAKDCIGCNPNKLSVNNNNINKDNKNKKAGVVIYGYYEDLESLLNVCYPYDEMENISYYGIIPLNLLKNRYHHSNNGCNLEISSSLGNIQSAFVKKFTNVYTKNS